jgi:predicted transcriptional regulator
MKEEKTIRVGIMSKEQYTKRTIVIVKSKYIPKKDEPKVWC